MAGIENLRAQILIWHKLLAQITGGLSIAYGTRKLSRKELTQWVRTLRGVADEIDAVASGLTASPTRGTVRDRAGEPAVATRKATGQVARKATRRQQGGEP